ncbi:MAG: prepilin-type N-terminal cleavage/methylation domain-containing protein [Armatimonadetes bacterium]|nr:prepilin-type N-terminal cleavage/methylation domain-containing protein [Armatimonadota bacterium]
MKPRRAFSFLELLLAVGLLAILAVAAMTISAVRSNQSMRLVNETE